MVAGSLLRLARSSLGCVGRHPSAQGRGIANARLWPACAFCLTAAPAPPPASDDVRRVSSRQAPRQSPRRRGSPAAQQCDRAARRGPPAPLARALTSRSGRARPAAQQRTRESPRGEHRTQPELWRRRTRPAASVNRYDGWMRRNYRAARGHHSASARLLDSAAQQEP